MMKVPPDGSLDERPVFEVACGNRLLIGHLAILPDRASRPATFQAANSRQRARCQIRQSRATGRPAKAGPAVRSTCARNRCAGPGRRSETETSSRRERCRLDAGLVVTVGGLPDRSMGDLGRARSADPGRVRITGTCAVELRRSAGQAGVVKRPGRPSEPSSASSTSERPSPLEPGYRKRSRPRPGVDLTALRDFHQPGRVLDEKRLSESRRRAAGWALVALIFCGGGVWLISSGNPVVGWPNAILFGLVVLASPARIWHPTTITFTNDGLRVKTALRSEWGCSWQDVVDVRIWEFEYYGRTALRAVQLELAGPSSSRGIAARTPGSNTPLLPSVGVHVEDVLAIARRYWRNTPRTRHLE